MAANLGDLITSTLRNFSETLEDNITTHNSLSRYLQRRGNVKRAVGGRVIDEGILYGSNSSIQWYDGYDTFTPPTTGQEVMDAAEFAWKQLGGFISVSGREEKINRGEYERFDFVERRVDQLQANLQNNFAASLFGDGTGSGGKELTGLQAAIPDAPTTGTYGGISRVTNTFWRSNVSAAVATNASNIQGRMNSLWLDTIRGKDAPDLIIAGNSLYSAYWQSLQAIQRIGNAREADAGYTSLKYMDADVFYDNNCANTRMYFINTRNMFLRVINDRLFEEDEMRRVTNADYKVWPVFFMGNLTCNRAEAHGVLLST